MTNKNGEIYIRNPFPLLLNPPPNTITPPHGFNIRGFLIIGSQKMDP